LTTEEASKHLIGGAKKVVISAPANSEDIKTIVLGVNDAIIELIKYFNEGVLINNDECYNLNWMIKNNYINK
jgi:glyceraldehyde 3-phosphate dehydrogenase